MKTSKAESLITDFELSEFYFRYLLLDTVLSNPLWCVPSNSEADYPEQCF